MARKAVEMLLEEIRRRRLGETLEPLQHVMNFTLVKRDSSAACEASAQGIQRSAGSAPVGRKRPFARIDARFVIALPSSR
jgi:hypothetical protein